MLKSFVSFSELSPCSINLPVELATTINRQSGLMAPRLHAQIWNTYLSAVLAALR